MSQAAKQVHPFEDLEVPLERDMFTRSLIRELSGLLEEMIGLEEAEGFISVVGQRIGTDIEQMYKDALQVKRLNKQQIIDVLLDLKARIEGEFFLIDSSDDKVEMGCNLCPFGDKVKDRASLCMMTSNVFGTITANNNGYAKVALDKTIAQGDKACHVTVYFNESDESRQADGREYYHAGD